MFPNVPERQHERHDHEGRGNLDERVTDIGIERMSEPRRKPDREYPDAFHVNSKIKSGIIRTG